MSDIYFERLLSDAISEASYEDFGAIGRLIAAIRFLADEVSDLQTRIEELEQS